MKGFTVDLPGDLAATLRPSVDIGGYASEADVVCGAIRWRASARKINLSGSPPAL